MSTKSEQPSLPGIDVGEIRLKALIENNPKPLSKEQAEKFFRNRCVATVTMKRDHDQLRVVLKSTDGKEDDFKFEQKRELPLHDLVEWEIRYIETAAEMHAYWLDLERKKN